MPDGITKGICRPRCLGRRRRTSPYCDMSSRASRWTNADNTAGSTSDTASQSMLGPLACATLNPRMVRSDDIGACDVCGPHEDVDRVLTVAVDERRNRTPLEIVKPASDQRKPFVGQVLHRRRVVESSGEPRLDGMPVR